MRRTWCFSLPLMGIGNPQRRCCPSLPRRRLITPHGDRKRKRHLRGAPTRDRAHYPSWGSETRSWACRGRRSAGTHYPSWGSETGVSPPGRCDEYISHYPSWGSETGGWVPGGDRRISHYPSWGSETRADRRRETAKNQLITPHGDRKPPRVFPAMMLSTVPLITPHGDRKRVAERHARGDGVCCSLPLMGIGNLFDPDRQVAQLHLLITPHGDRKHAAGAALNFDVPLLITPHGDRKPRIRCLPCRPTTASLPLMGIGNPDSRKLPPETSASSLPLMGIGNSCSCWRSPSEHQLLITPHGDRKPYLQKPTRALRSSYAQTTLPPCPNAVS